MNKFCFSKNTTILSLEFFLDLSAIVRNILKIFLNTGPDYEETRDLCMTISIVKYGLTAKPPLKYCNVKGP